MYADELVLRIYNGIDGEVLLQESVGSHALLELPVIVDVDNDNNAEIVVPSNDYLYGPKTGIQVYGDLNDTWVNTRKIWNQHGYHITNVNDNGTIPQFETNNWEIFNNYRQNEMLNPLGCVDLSTSYLKVVRDGASGQAYLSVRVGNSGILHIQPGIDISFYQAMSRRVIRGPGAGVARHIFGKTILQRRFATVSTMIVTGRQMSS